MVDPFLLDRLEAEGTAAMLPGVLELTHWDRFQPLLADRSLSLILSNVYQREGNERRPLVHRTLMVDVRGVRVGLIGVMDRSVFAKVKPPEALALEIEDPATVIAELAPTLQERCDLVAVMACMDDRDAFRLATELEGVDLVLGGYQSIPSDRPLLAGRTIVSRSGMRGQVLNTTRLIVSPAGDIVDWFGYNYPLSARYPEDAAVESLVVDITRRAEMALLGGVRGEAQAEVVPGTEATPGADALPVTVPGPSVRYVGATGCGACHSAQYRQWSRTAHARAFEAVLASEGAIAGERVARYVTGYGELSGYRADSQTPDLRGVQCEACHGPASSHARGAGARPVTEDTCRPCHTVAENPGWSFPRALAAVRH